MRARGPLHGSSPARVLPLLLQHTAAGQSDKAGWQGTVADGATTHRAGPFCIRRQPASPLRVPGCALRRNSWGRRAWEGHTVRI